MYYLHNLNSSSYPKGWLWLSLLPWNYSWYLSHYYVPGFSLHHFGMSPRCLVEKVKAITVTVSDSESLWCLPLVLHVLVTVSTAVTNTMTKGILGREGFVPQLLVQPPSLLLPPRTTCPGGPTHMGCSRQSVIKTVLCRPTCTLM